MLIFDFLEKYLHQIFAWLLKKNVSHVMLY